MQKLALAIRLAIKYREESSKYEDITNETIPDFSFPQIFYTSSIKQAVDKAVAKVGLDNNASELINILLTSDWNSALIWAESID